MRQTEPLKTGFLVSEVDGDPQVLPVNLQFPNGSLSVMSDNTVRVDCLTASTANELYIQLNGASTTTAIIPFAVGVKIKAGEKLVLDGA